MDNTHGLPVFSGAAPALLVGGHEDIDSALQQAALQTFTTLLWRYKADGAVPAVLVVPMHEPAHPHHRQKSTRAPLKAALRMDS